MKGKVCSVPRVKRSDALLFANPEQSVEHASVAHLCVLRLTLHLQPGLGQINRKCPCELK